MLVTILVSAKDCYLPQSLKRKLDMAYNVDMITSRSVVPLFVGVTLLLGYNYIAANWTGPGGTPPANNAAVPINVSSTTQTKLGNFVANIMAGSDHMRSPRYCDANGNNCWDPTTGLPGAGVGTVTVGGQCFAPSWAVTCNWNWSGDGNDNSTYIRPISMDPGSVCASVGRSYQYHSMILARC
jgi:hypothetical protein